MNLNLLIIVLATSTIGSFVRIAEENSESRIKWSKVVAIVACAYGMATAAYLIAMEGYLSEFWAGTGSLALSIFAVEIVSTLRNTIGPALADFIKGLPAAFLGVVINNFGKPNNNNNDKNELDNK